MTGVREELAARIAGGSNQHPASSNVKTARAWRGILSFTHLAREGRMTVTIGRRELLIALGGTAAWPLAGRAQQVMTKLPTIGFLGSATLLVEGQRVAAFVQRLRQLGWIENRNVAIEYRWAEGRTERFTELAAEFARLKVDLIVAATTPAVVAAKQATSVIPIVITT